MEGAKGGKRSSGETRREEGLEGAGEREGDREERFQGRKAGSQRWGEEVWVRVGNSRDKGGWENEWGHNGGEVSGGQVWGEV